MKSDIKRDIKGTFRQTFEEKWREWVVMRHLGRRDKAESNYAVEGKRGSVSLSGTKLALSGQSGLKNLLVELIRQQHEVAPD